MKFATIISLAIAAAAVNAVSIPKEHHTRFLQERETLLAELANWKDSAAGQAARANGFYTETNEVMSEGVENDHLARFFNSKLAAEEAARENPDAVYGVNSPFTLMTNEEFEAFVARSSRKVDNLRDGATEVHAVSAEALKSLPKSVDHTTGSCVGPVKDQGQCGSCWAFSATAAIETAVCQSSGKLQLFAEQEIVSCANTSSQGCDGGWPKDGIAYANSHGGMCTAESYDYTSGTSGDSAFDSCASKEKSCTTVPFHVTTTKVGNSESAFMTALVDRPLSVAVAAGNLSWKQYESGVVKACRTAQLDHAVYAVGYDATSFKIKNSWGTSWGEDGYIRLGRISTTKAACSLINPYAVYATASQ